MKKINFATSSADIKEAVEQALDVADLAEKTRKQDILIARQLYCYFSDKHTTDKPEVIGKNANIDRTTVYCCVRKINNDLSYNDRVISMAYNKCLPLVKNISCDDNLEIKKIIAYHKQEIQNLQRFLK